MIYELREYTAVPGRMPDLIRRFNEHALKGLARHGMEVVFISLTEFGTNTMNEIVYVLRFDSYDELERKWNALLADPEWIEAKRLSEVNGPLVASLGRRILTGNPFTQGRP
ncbi:NIPSNAP family protein [Kitasatospora sp. NPDC097605]|uniref:NIPSNAP family protein n=1 Tax=Kitasatospora sp. NPDC097605 TaxID=3157226 RepID=UPI003324126F